VDLFEHQGKGLFAKHGIPVPEGIVARTPEEARRAAESLGGSAVVKVQVQIGGRGKGGGVAMVDSPEDAERAAAELLGSGFKGMKVDRVLVEERLRPVSELYAAVTLDRTNGDYLAMFSSEGGMDVEEIARTRPEALRRRHIDPQLGMQGYQARYLVDVLPAEARGPAAEVMARLYEALAEEDATLVEVNPLVLVEGGGVVALDSKVTIDDNALFRHPDVAALADSFPADPTEMRAKKVGLQYVKLEGSVGVIGNGAGLVMSTLDLVAQAGGRPANFLDIGGGASAELMATSLEVVLSDPAVRCVLINVFGGITRCDEVAEGIIDALAEVGATVPIVVRLDGTNAEQGRRMLLEAASEWIVPEPTMSEAATEAARRAG